jgi:hypothetical protein
LIYRPFVRLDAVHLVTHDRTVLTRFRIDPHNTGWVGRGTVHETFSLMPSLFRTEQMREALGNQCVGGGPAEFERHFATLWEYKKLVGYLNGQAFCYHIGAAGKAGPGGYLGVGDQRYEDAWSHPEL